MDTTTKRLLRYKVQNTTRTFGWRPQLPNILDPVFRIPPRIPPSPLPANVDLTSLMPPVLDQGQIGSCVANAIATAIQFTRKKQGEKTSFVPSRLFNYWCAREMENTTAFDAGAIIRDSIQVIKDRGAPSEYYWQYKDTMPNADTNMWQSKDKPRRKPSLNAFKQGLTKQAISFEVVPTELAPMRGCLAAGFPFVFGFSVYQSFLSAAVAKTGIVPIPSRTESLVGGHAVLCIGYDDSKNWFICRNSWGESWGVKGNFYLPYDFFIKHGLVADLWTVRSSE